MCVIDGDLGSSGLWINGLVSSFPTSINFSFTSMHFQTLLLSIFPPVI